MTDDGHGHRHGAAGGHGHLHAPLAAGLDRRLLWGVALNLVFVAAEFAAGVWASSLALLADAGHNAGDVVGLLLAWGAHWLARRPPSRRFTWGLRRATIYAALGNAVLMFAACGAILWEAAHRLRDPSPVAGTTVIAVAALGVVVNTLTALLLAGGRRDANVRAAFLHMAADAAVSAGVVLAGIAIQATGLSWIDPAVSMLVTFAILWGAWGLFREGLELALDAVPRGFEPEAIAAALAAIPGVAEVHDLHVWGASTSETSLTAHLVVPDAVAHGRVLAAAGDLVRTTFHVAHVTLQIEDEAGADRCPQRPADTL
jgi:cobalt-zinc-cadmium efflux system protein